MNNKGIYILRKPNATKNTNSFDPVCTHILAIIISSERKIIDEV